MRKKDGGLARKENGTQYAFHGSRYGRILSDREFADRRRNQNRKIFSNMSLANSRKLTYHLERQHNGNKG
eukprot:10401714-Ditylum_brightwellii.AAC.1